MNNFLKASIAASLLGISGTTMAFAADLGGTYEAPVVEDGHGGVRIGYLSCDIGEGGGYLLGSAKELDCIFKSASHGGRTEQYVGAIKKIGVDLGYTARGKLVWAVFAPTAGYHHGSLGGTYVGASAEATLGAGIGANVLIGGTRGSIELQTVSVSGQLGLNVAAAGTTVTLNAL